MKNSKIDKVLGMLSPGVYVLTSECEEDSNGCTVSWVSRVSFDPPIISVSVAPERMTHGYLKQSKAFALSILPENERGVELARQFGVVSGRKCDQFAHTKIFTDKTGAPIIKDSVGYIECKILFSTDAGDHTIFFGEVISGNLLLDDVKGLLYGPSTYL